VPAPITPDDEEEVEEEAEGARAPPPAPRRSPRLNTMAGDTAAQHNSANYSATFISLPSAGVTYYWCAEQVPE